MTNMMTGAVAINGGVGVMEIYQPLPQAVENVAQAVEDLAVNAHISLRELKNRVNKVLEKKIPGYKQLMAMNPEVAARTMVNGATLTAYTNGYATYEEDDAHTVLVVDRCGDYRYEFNDGTYEVVPTKVFEDAEWSVRLVMEGERRLKNNRSKISRDYEEFALSCDGTDWCDAAMVDFMEAENAEMLAAQQKVNDTQHRIELVEAQISLQTKDSEKAQNDIQTLIGEAEKLSWKNDWHTMLTEFGKEVEDGAITYKMNTEKQQKLAAELKQFEEGNKNLAAVLDAIVKLIAFKSFG